MQRRLKRIGAVRHGLPLALPDPFVEHGDFFFQCVDVLLDRIDLRLQRIAAGAFLRYIIAQPFKLRIVFRFRRIQLLELCLQVGNGFRPDGRQGKQVGIEQNQSCK